MNRNDHQKRLKMVPFSFRLSLYVGIILLLSNLNAIVDVYQHPNIPYFDEEHLIVGSVAGSIVIILLMILECYFRSLSKALNKIKSLESFLSICANCKKIRIPGADPLVEESWEQIESYISENTFTKFSHGICPACHEKLYPDLVKREKS